MTTKEKIIAAAKAEFYQKGFTGARMQEIADRCGINKALLHYHFTNKELLFRAVLLSGILELFPNVLATLNAPLPLREKLVLVVDTYMDFLAKNPELPGFVLHELSLNSNFIQNNLPGFSGLPTTFVAQIEQSFALGEIAETSPIQILADIIGLCAFPFLAKPMLQFISGMSDKDFNEFIAQRKQHVKLLVTNGLFVKNQNT